MKTLFHFISFLQKPICGGLVGGIDQRSVSIQTLDMIQHVTHVSEMETENFADSLHVTRDNYEPGGALQQQQQVKQRKLENFLHQKIKSLQCVKP